MFRKEMQTSYCMKYVSEIVNPPFRHFVHLNLNGSGVHSSTSNVLLKFKECCS